MCGIVGYIGTKKAIPILLDGLKRLEYRGYDSAGIAVLGKKDLHSWKAQGKLENLTSKLKNNGRPETMGVGHTRWATHGKPSERNAHPHQSGRVVLVHNGIIENYQTLKTKLTKKGGELSSETDTEIVCALVNQLLKKGVSFLEAFRKVLQMIEGTYAFVLMDTNNPNQLFVAKKGSPLVVGLAKDETFIASDIPAILPYTKKVTFLENGEMAICGRDGIIFYNKDFKLIQKTTQEITWTADMAEKGGHKHFMLKEIMEQPHAIADTLSGRVVKGGKKIELDEVDALFKNTSLSHFHRIYMIACGTSWHAALAGKYYMEAIAKIPVSVDTASEFRYREPFMDRYTLLIVISQSGETADTLACVQEAKKKGAKVISICNAVDSSIPRICHANLYTHAGPEIGVASTKAFTTQMVVLLMLSLYLGRKKNNAVYVQNAIDSLLNLPILMEKVLAKKNELLRIAEKYHPRRDFYFIARGVHFPIALEGALKLKEISYIHAEGYAAGEMKHGPIALIEPGTPIVALAPDDRVCSKMISNIEEVKARGASVIAIVTEGDKRLQHRCDHLFYLPKTLWYVTPILASIPLQLLAYYVADLKGTDVDQPRNLAKSVTVE